jgi:hypothetical protein
MDSKMQGEGIEPLLPVSDAAQAIGVETWKLSRAVRRGDIPHYTLYNTRKLVRLSEVIATIEASRQFGDF